MYSERSTTVALTTWASIFVAACARQASPMPDAYTAEVDSGASTSGRDAGAGPSCTPVPYAPPGADESWDAWMDARGESQRFERVDLGEVTGRGAVSLVSEETASVSLTDVDDDGLVDILILEQGRSVPGAARYFRNRGCWQFERAELGLPGTAAAFNSTTVFTDFDSDGALDLLLTRRTYGTSAYRGTPDGFVDVTASVGIDTAGIYASQPQVADLNLDGYLDLVIVADTIGADGGRPAHRMYVYEPASARFVDYGARDEVVPDFAPAPGEPCDPDTFRSGPSVLVRDLDDDGDPDIVHPYHRDIIDSDARTLFDDCSPAVFGHGVAVWENLTADTGAFRFRRVPEGPGGGLVDSDSVLAERTSLAERSLPLTYEGHATSLPYVAAADVDNDGDLDLAVTGPTDPQWHGQSDRMSGKFWRNEGSWSFRAVTGGEDGSGAESAGLEAMNWTYGRWADFWDDRSFPTDSPFIERLCGCSYDTANCTGFGIREHQFYGGDLVFGDYDNDGWIDLLLVDRHEMEGGERHLRNVLFHNDGDGTFTPETAEVSGVDSNSITAEAADLDGDGLLDLVFGASPGNSSGRANVCLGDEYLRVADAQYLDRVYWNTGRVGGASSNHWIRVRLRGLPTARLVGARIFAQEPGTRDCSGTGEGRTCIGRRDYYPVSSYKSSHGLEAHFGLGRREHIDLRVELPGVAGTEPRSVIVEDVPIDALVDVDVTSGMAIAR